MMMKNIFLILSMLLVIVGSTYGQSNKLKSFPLSDVELLESPFYEAEQTDMKYMLALDPDRLLAPFVIDAGLAPKAERYGNWENTGLDGHIGGHYLSALSQMYASTGNPELLRRLNYMIDVLAQCQEKNGNGYVGGIPGGQEMWKEVAAGKIDAGSFSLNGKWVPLYNIHKLFAGLRDAYLIAGNEKAKEILVKLSDWLLKETANLSNEQIQEMLRSEQGGMNEVLADVADITGENKYLMLAEKFSQKRLLEPLLQGKDELTGLHANTQIPKVIGYERIAEMGADTRWANAAEFFWETVVHNRTVSIGGNSVREHFNPTDDFSSMIESNQGPETCNTYNMLRLTKMLFLTHPQAKYMDYFERALYNHILSSQDPKGGFVYFTPMRPRHYRVYSQPQQDFWCCVGSGLENHSKYGDMIYAHNEKDIYVNLFIPSQLEWKEGGIVLTQKTNFPFEETSTIELKLDKAARFNINIRYPSWVNDEEFQIRINGQAQELSSAPSSYVTIDRKWKSGDRISINLPMHTSIEYLPDSSNWISFLHGPIVLAAVTDSTDLTGLWADDSRMGHVASGRLYPIDEAPMVVAETDSEIISGVKPVKDTPLTFTINDLIYPEKYKNLKLIPFFKIHEARYMIYWPVVNRENLETKIRELKKKEEEMLALEAQTVDQIATGEQQPESDHNFKGEKTRSGLNEGIFWRDSQSWFSYDLNNKNEEGKIIRITYFGRDKDRTFDILLDGRLLTTVKLDGSKGGKFYDVDYDIPGEILDADADHQLTIKFVAHEGSIAGGIYHIRLLKE